MGGMFYSSEVVALFVFITVWSVVWKGLALWKAANKKHKYWFVALLIINSIGLLEILYYGYFSEKKSKKQRKQK